MAECKICGKRDAETVAKIEGVNVNVCRKCVSYGKEMPRVEIRPSSKPVLRMGGEDEQVVSDFKDVVKKKRAKMNLSQKDLAVKIGERESVVKRIENGWMPPTKIVRKLEKFLSLKLREDVVESGTATSGKKKKLTIGDVVEVS